MDWIKRKQDRLFDNMVNYNSLSPIEKKAHDIEMYAHLKEEFKKDNIEVDELL